MYIFTYMCTYVYIPTSKNSGPRPWCHSPHFFLLNLKYMYRLYNVHLNPYDVYLHIHVRMHAYDIFLLMFYQSRPRDCRIYASPRSVPVTL